MATNPATVADIEARWRPLTAAEQVVATTLLADAWAMLKRRDTTIETRLDAIPATLDVALARMVIVEMVKRVLRNPDAVRQESIQDYSYTRDAAGATGLLSVTDDELDLLASSGVAAGLFTIRPAYQVPVGTPAFDPLLWEWR